MCVKINLRNGKGNRIRKMNADAESKLYKGKHSSKRTTNLKSKDDHMNITWKRKGTNLGGSGGFQSVNSGQKRKRVFAEQYDGSTRRVDDLEDVYKAKALSRNGESKHKENFIKEKRKTKRGSQDIVQSNRQNSMIRRVKSTENDLPSKKGNTNLRAKMKKVDGVSNVDQHGNPNGMLKKGGNIKSNMPKLMNEKRSKFAVEFPEKSLKKKVQDKKSMADKSKLIEDQPKKKKRVIRIDPNDTSNKRLRDGMVEIDKTKKEDNLEKENVEMSKNAQFRAIQPSPSILSFVDENLLGRRREIELRRAGYNTDLSAPLDNIPFSTSLERERIEQSIFRNKLTFFAAAKVSSSFPPPGLLEIAFAGRSNVGKSSLLNSLTRQWGVVRTSDKPGLTQTINFFKLGANACLVDLPGYGFAYAKEEVKEAWQELVKEYVSTRVGLKRVCLLIDTKWGMKPRDHELVNLMERSQTKYQIILTKTDLVFPIDVARRAMQIEESLIANKSVVQPLMMASSKSGAGIGSLRTVLAKIARFAKP